MKFFESNPIASRIVLASFLLAVGLFVGINGFGSTHVAIGTSLSVLALGAVFSMPLSLKKRLQWLAPATIVPRYVAKQFPDNHVQFLTEPEQFYAFIQNPTAIVAFGSAYCQPCKVLTVELEQWAQRDGLPIAKIDIDDMRQIAHAAEIQAVPTTMIFHDGRKIGENLIGPRPLASLQQWFKQTMAVANN